MIGRRFQVATYGKLWDLTGATFLFQSDLAGVCVWHCVTLCDTVTLCHTVCVCVAIFPASDARSILNPLDWQPTIRWEIKIAEEFSAIFANGSRAEAIARIVETIWKCCAYFSDCQMEIFLSDGDDSWLSDCGASHRPSGKSDSLLLKHRDLLDLEVGSWAQMKTAERKGI